MKTGLILNNIGTPESPEPKDVKIYLDEFLMDPDVIGLPFPLRWLLVKGLITPRRSHKSAEKYQAVWMKEGSPLMVYSRGFAERLQTELGSDWIVEIGMRYGNPSLSAALEKLRDEGVKKLVLAPLFPQYAEATTGSAVKETKRLLSEMKWNVPLKIVPPFYNRREFLSAQAELLIPQLKSSEHVLFSFHGLPESQVRQNEGCLKSSDCCDRPSACAMNCYRAQCVQTARGLADLLGLPKEKWSLSFQSRLGPAKWIGPSTDDRLQELAQQKVKSLMVACPAFVADCLETLEEIGLGGKEDFLKWGGLEFQLVPCVNQEMSWVRGFKEILMSSAGEKIGLEKAD